MEPVSDGGGEKRKGKPRHFGAKKKKKIVGIAAKRREEKVKKISGNANTENESEIPHDSGEEESAFNVSNVSASERKILRPPNDNEDYDGEKTHGFALIDTELLRNFLNNQLRCSICASTVTTNQVWDESKGYAVKFMSVCESCKPECDLFTSSKRCQKKGEGSGSSPFEVNVRMSTFARESGKGHSMLVQFSRSVNTTTISHRSYDDILDQLHKAY